VPLLLDAVTSSTTSVPFDANNHWTATGVTYDAGNLTNVVNGSNSLQATYDAENRQITTNSTLAGSTTTTTVTNYRYDGDGKRVQKVVSGGATTTYLYDAQGQLTAEYSTANNPDSGTQYLTSDNLGSLRLVTNAALSPVGCSDYLPFGQEIPTTWGNRANCVPDPSETLKFTGKERDAETGLDNFGARYMSSAQGRFTSPDPSIKGIALADPQSWNLYSYVRNRPTRFIDVEGNWATDVHAQIVTYALQGYISVGELNQLRAAQYAMDADQSDQNRHAMVNQRQSPQDASNSMWTFVSSQMTIASQNVGADGTLNGTGLHALGNAMHTVEDYTSPQHTDSNFTLMVWNGGFWPPSKIIPGAAHVWGESSPDLDWSRIGYAVRLTMAVYLQSGAGCEAGKRCLTEKNFDSEVQRNIEDYVSHYYNYTPGGSPIMEEAARQCARCL
jgi:RHS repeat-associated protein